MKKDKQSKFSRVLQTKDVLVLAFGAMIGWGWVVQAGDWILGAGTIGAALAFVMGGLMIYFVGLTYAELTSAMPKCGGEHVFSQRALGKTVSFICTWSLILSYISVVLFEVISLPTVLEYIFPGLAQVHLYTIAGYDIKLTMVLVGVVGAIIITLINYFGVKMAAVVQTVLVCLMAAIGIALMSGSLVSGNIGNIQPLFSDGLGGVLKVLVLTPFFYMGFDVIPQAAEEINIPFKKIGKIMLLSIILAVVWHLIIIISVSFVMSEGQMALSNLVTAEAMKLAFGNKQIFATILILGGLSGIITSWNAFFVGGSRAIYAMAESEMLPSCFAKLSKHKTPTIAIIFIGIVSCIAPFFGRKALLWVSNAGGFSVVVAYFIVSISFLVLRFKEPNMERPYKVKCGILVGVLAVIMSGFVLSLYLIPGLPSCLTLPEWIIVGVWLLIGLIMYVVYKLKPRNE